jgi:hypothetical protein
MISQHKAGQFRLGKQISKEDGSDRHFAMSCRRCEKVGLAFLDFTTGKWTGCFAEARLLA